jgi:hypothetical protein
MTWNNITIRKYIALSQAMSAKYEDNEQMTFAILSVLHDKPKEYFESSIPVTELTKHIKDMQFIYTKETTTGFPTRVKVGLKRYKIEHNVSELTSGQYIDLSTYCKDPETINKNYHKIIAVLVSPMGLFGDKFKRKIKKAKTQAELEMVHLKIWKERQELSEVLLDELTMDKVFQITNYFFLLYQNLIKSIPSYLEKKKRMALQELSQVLEEVGLQNIGAGLLH